MYRCCGFLLIWLLLSQCADNAETEARHTPQAQKTAAQTEMKSVCECFDAAVATMDSAIVLRNSYATLQEYEADSDGVQQMSGLLKKWRELQKQCLITFGAKMFRESDCNRPDEIAEKRKELRTLGIST